MAKQQEFKYPPKTAVIGARGFIGSHFLRMYRQMYPDCIGTQRKEGKVYYMPRMVEKLIQAKTHNQPKIPK